MNPLPQLHVDIDTRVSAIRDSQPDWLCRQGCDGCCRRLAQVPEITLEEWRWLQEGLKALASEQLREVGREIAALIDQKARPIICPLLDKAKGACLVYAHRPVACRTYGFYVQREQGLYCKDIEARVSGGLLGDVVWGNHDGIDHRLRALGDSRELPAWFAEWQPDMA
jgi:Fe-S-cluster containining protein